MRLAFLGFAFLLPFSAAADTLPSGHYEGRGDGTLVSLDVSGSSAAVGVGRGGRCGGSMEGRVYENGEGWQISDGVCSLTVERTGSGYSFTPTPETEKQCFGYGGQGCSLVGEVALTNESRTVPDEDPTADYKAARCELVVNGKTHGEGDCRFYPGRDGSFQIHFPNGIFADVSVEGAGRAMGFWTGPLPASHAHDRLGPLIRDDACWVSETIRVCAW